MTWATIARRDFQDAVQSKALWALVVTFVVLSTITSYAFAEAPELFGVPGDTGFEDLIVFTTSLLALFVPLAAIVVCYKSIAGERERGSMKVLLSLPTTRRDVFLGKLLGRTAVLWVGLGVGLLVGMVFGAALLGTVDVAPLVVFVFLTLAFVAVYAAIMVGISATTGSTTRATTLALGFFVLLELVWDVILLGVLYVTSGFEVPVEIPGWFGYLAQLSPSSAYVSSIIAFLPEPADEADADEVGAGAFDIAIEMPEVGALVLVAWFVLAVVVGALRFQRADL